VSGAYVNCAGDVFGVLMEFAPTTGALYNTQVARGIQQVPSTTLPALSLQGKATSPWEGGIQLTSRDYELMYIVRPDMGEESAVAKAEDYRQLLEELGAEVRDVDDWGSRRLAYEIDDYPEGHYTILEFWGDSDAVNEVDRRMRLDEDIIRFMMVRQSE